MFILQEHISAQETFKFQWASQGSIQYKQDINGIPSKAQGTLQEKL